MQSCSQDFLLVHRFWCRKSWCSRSSQSRWYMLYMSHSLRKHPSFFAPGSSGVSREGRYWDINHLIFLLYCQTLLSRARGLGDWETTPCVSDIISYLILSSLIISSLIISSHLILSYLRTSAIHRQNFHTDDVSVNLIILNKLSFAVTKGLCQAANVLHSHRCTSYGSNFRRKEYFRNTSNW